MVPFYLLGVLVALVWLAAPFWALWMIFRASRDLHRMADAIVHVAYDVPRLRREIVKTTEERAAAREAGVANSMFGR